MSESTLTSLPDPVSWHDQADCVYMSILNFDVGFYKPYGVFALRPGGIRAILNEPAIYVVVRPWFKVATQPWDRFNAGWPTTTLDYAGEAGEPWDTVLTFGWDHEFDVRDPPAGPDCRVKNYIQLFPNHSQYQYITKITPYVDLENIGIQYAHFVKQEYVSVINAVCIEKTDGSLIYLPLQEVRDIKTEIPDTVLRLGLVYQPPGEPEEILYFFDETIRNWDHVEIQTELMNVGGETFWVCLMGGANLETPQPVAANEEVIF